MVFFLELTGEVEHRGPVRTMCHHELPRSSAGHARGRRQVSTLLSPSASLGSAALHPAFKSAQAVTG